MIVPVADTRRGAAFNERFQRGHLCAECGGTIVEATCGQPGLLWVGCVNREHRGFERVRGWWERWKAGEWVPGEIAEGLRKREERMKK